MSAVKVCHFFARAIISKMDYQCPATQDAIDRLIAARGIGDRAAFLDQLRGGFLTENDSSGASQFHMAVLEAWTDADLVLATGQNRDIWLLLSERLRDEVVA